MKSNKFKYIGGTVLFLLVTWSIQAQQAAAVGAEGGSGADPFFYERGFTTVLLIVAGVVILGALAVLSNLLSVMVKIQQMKIYQEQGLEAYLQEVEKEAKVKKESFWDRMYKRWTKAVPVEKEQDVMLDHNYDGIRELDNTLPPWWVAMFYITIAFAVVYMTYYHFTGAGPSSKEEFEMQMTQAEEAVQAYLARQGNTIDETNVVALTDDQSLAFGQTIFNTQCATCHREDGGGSIGPNLTDEYWIHGGKINEIFATIKYGVPEKGMISWQTQLRPNDMQRVASYILTLQGTNPPDPKAPEGEKVEPQATTEGGDAAPESEGEAVGMNEEIQE